MSPESSTIQLLMAGIIGGATPTAILAYFGKKYIDHKLRKDLEAFKSELKVEEQVYLKQIDSRNKARQTIWPYINAIFTLCGSFKSNDPKASKAIEVSVNNLEEYVANNEVHFNISERHLLELLIEKAGSFPEETTLFNNMEEIKHKLAEMLIY